MTKSQNLVNFEAGPDQSLVLLCRVQEWLLSIAGLFELSPLNEIYRGKLVHSITLIMLTLFKGELHSWGVGGGGK